MVSLQDKHGDDPKTNRNLRKVHGAYDIWERYLHFTYIKDDEYPP